MPIAAQSRSSCPGHNQGRESRPEKHREENQVRRDAEIQYERLWSPARRSTPSDLERQTPATVPPVRDASPEHLVRLQQYRLRDRNAKPLGGFQIDDKLNGVALLERQVARLGALEQAIDEVRGTVESVKNVSAVGHQSSRLGGVTE